MIRVTAAAACLLALAGCGKGLDRTPDLSSLENYKAKLNEIFSEIPPAEQEAFNWVANQMSFELLKQHYSGKTYRQFAVGALDKAIPDAKAMITELEQQKKKFDPILEDVLKIGVTTSDPGLRHANFNQEFEFTAQIDNHSSLDLSAARWIARLYLDDAKEPAAAKEVYVSFKSEGGLRSGQSSTQRIRPERFPSMSHEWQTLAVKNAKSYRVEMEIGDAYGFDDKSFFEGAPYANLKKQQSWLMAAEQHRATLSK